LKRFISVLSGLLLFFIFVLINVQGASAASTWTKYYYGSNFYYKVYVPSTYNDQSNVPLMVMLHGCGQNANDFANGTQMNALAENKGFIVLYPEMNYAANLNGCWNWFYTYNQVRGDGEPAIIKGMVDKVKSQYKIDNNKVYVAGMSAGAFIATIMGVTYPDVFHAVGIHSGGDYSYAYDAFTGSWVMLYGTINPIADGDAAFHQMGTNARAVPIIVFHGNLDTVVNPINASQAIQQWARTNTNAGVSMDTTADTITNGQVTNGDSYTIYDYKDNNGNNWMRKVLVNSMSHAWSGGNSTGSYTDPRGPNASQMMWDFFTSH
jgi:poly(hydroxyalkanoate) depolymerase family esterase